MLSYTQTVSAVRAKTDARGTLTALATPDDVAK